MELQINDIISRYEEELRAMTRRAILAEAEATALKTKRDEGEEDTNGD